MLVHINVAEGDLTVAANLQPACLHANLAAADALGVQSTRLLPSRECLDCAYAALQMAMDQSPSRPELRWQAVCFMPDGLARPGGWRAMLLRGHDRARTTVVAETLPGAMFAAAWHLNERAYRFPLGERMPDELAYVDERDDAE